MPPSTKMIPLDHISCSIRLSDVFIVSRTLRPAGYTHFRIWNRFTTDWETCSLHDDLAASIADNQDIVRTISRPAKPRALKYRTGQTLHNRGIPDGVQRKGVKRVRQLFLFGSSADDTETVRKAIYRWAFEDTLPTRKQPDENGTGGFQPSYWHGEEGRAKEAVESWQWYHHDGGREAFEDRQFDDNISSEAIQEFLPEGSGRSFLMGPYQTPKLFKLGVCETMSLSQAWEATEANGLEHSQQSDQTKRHGFMINVGSKVFCSEWAPNQSGPDQYLAVSALPPRALVPGQQFKPQQPHAASIQLWRFRANVQGVISMDERPFLDTLLCTRWGDVKAIKWCPTPHNEAADANNISVGLLAGVWGDGALRVLDIRTQAGKEATSYRLVSKPAFEVAPPGTVFNSVTWVNSTRIAAGCANGCVAIFDLPNSLLTNPPKPPRPCSNRPFNLTCPSRPIFRRPLRLLAHLLSKPLGHPRPHEFHHRPRPLGPQSRPLNYQPRFRMKPPRRQTSPSQARPMSVAKLRLPSSSQKGARKHLCSLLPASQAGLYLAERPSRHPAKQVTLPILTGMRLKSAMTGLWMKRATKRRSS